MNICIFGAASGQIDKTYIEAVEELCAELAKRGHSLVFGAGAHGLMGAAARGFHSVKGTVTGVVPEFFRTDGVEDLYEECDEFIYTQTMAQRKAKMEELADCFITVPGGIGTFEEFFEVLVQRQLNLHTRPIAVYDVNNYYEALETMLERAVEECFLRDSRKDLYRYFKENEKEALISYIEREQKSSKSVSELKFG